MEALISRFRTSGDVSSGFQSQSGQPYMHLAEAYVLHIPGDSPLVRHLPNLSQPADELYFRRAHLEATSLSLSVNGARYPVYQVQMIRTQLYLGGGPHSEHFLQTDTREREDGVEHHTVPHVCDPVVGEKHVSPVTNRTLPSLIWWAMRYLGTGIQVPTFPD